MVVWDGVLSVPDFDRDNFHADTTNSETRSDLVLATSLVGPENEFDNVWSKILQSLGSGGIFCGSFLGPNDSMASPDFDRDAYWPNVLVFEEDAC